MDAVRKIAIYIKLFYRHFAKDSLRRTSSLLILSQIVNAAGAFIFWVICAHLFSTKLVGLAVALTSFAVLASTFTNLGLPNTVIRFLPTSKNRSMLFTTAFYLVFFVSVVGGIISLLIIRATIPTLGFITSSTFLSVVMVLLVAGNSLSSLMDGTLLAFRKGQYILAKAVLINLPRIILPFFVISFGLKGITGIYPTVLLVGITFNVYIATNKLLGSSFSKPKISEISKHKVYAAANYFGGMLGVLPGSLVPIIVLERLGPVSTAYFYMPMQIASFLGVISSSVSQALIAESSQNNDEQKHRLHFKNALIHLYRILVPAALILCAAGWPILRFYGKAYASSGIAALLVLVAASLFVGINWLGDTWLNIKKDSKGYFIMNAFNAIIVVSLVFILAPYGLLAVAAGWLSGQFLSALVYLLIFNRNHLFSIRRAV